MVRATRHPRAGKIRTLGNPVKLAPLDDDACPPSPALGEHTRRILAEVHEYAASRIDALVAAAIVAEPGRGTREGDAP